MLIRKNGRIWKGEGNWKKARRGYLRRPNLLERKSCNFKDRVYSSRDLLSKIIENDPLKQKKDFEEVEKQEQEALQRLEKIMTAVYEVTVETKNIHKSVKNNMSLAMKQLKRFKILQSEANLNRKMLFKNLE